MNRTEILQYYKENPEVSVLIVGAGVNGIGTFRDLALQGVDVLLVDKGDFCSGASAASSHMVHGGIRYLENGEFRLVSEAVKERNRLIENAPHYVKPLPTVMPVFKWFSGIFNAPLKFVGMLTKPSERGAIIIKIGMMLYDAYTRGQGTVPKHQFWPRKIAFKKFPKINPKILFAARYYDGSMHTPERICVEMVTDGEAAGTQANALNYVSLEYAAGNAITLKDEVNGEAFTVCPKVLINAAGPWIDIANQKMGLTTKFIGGTKGSHLILDNPELRAAIGENEFFFENKDGRIVLIYPMKDKVMIGTSDLHIDSPDDVRCTEAEIDYFFDIVPVVFPGIPLNRDQIVFQFSGVRPLPAADENNPLLISRDHSIRVTEPGEGLDIPIFSLVGGKWTSFRAFSEEVTDKTLTALGKTRKSDTRDLAIGGGRKYPHDFGRYEMFLQDVNYRTELSFDDIEILFERYGTRAMDVAMFMAEAPDMKLAFLPEYSQREIQFIAQQEKVVHLDDFLLRRSMLAKLGQLTHANINEIANVLGSALEWSAEQLDAEIKRAYQVLRENHGVTL